MFYFNSFLASDRLGITNELNSIHFPYKTINFAMEDQEENLMERKPKLTNQYFVTLIGKLEFHLVLVPYLYSSIYNILYSIFRHSLVNMAIVAYTISFGWSSSAIVLLTSGNYVIRSHIGPITVS